MIPATPMLPATPVLPATLVLPATWRSLSPDEAQRLAPAFARELDPRHPLASAQWQLIARHASQDSLVAEAPALEPRFYLLHLAWDQGVPKTPHALESLADLDGILDPPADAVDLVSLWCDATSQLGAVFVEHLLDGQERLTPLDWPAGQVLPASTQDLQRLGWRQIEGPLYPHAQRDGQWLPTGQIVEYWSRPVADDFMLLRAVATPGEAISLRKLIPDDGLLIEFDSQAALEAALPKGFNCRFISPMAPRFGLAGFPSDPAPAPGPGPGPGPGPRTDTAQRQRPQTKTPSPDTPSRPGILRRLISRLWRG